MDLQEFIKNAAICFEDTDPNEINADTVFKNLEEWSSLTTLELIAMVKTKYNKTITGKDIRQSNTVEDLFNAVSSK
ncbi:MAG TPA: acyl carrier protein [Dysgonomonas sp.]|nr:acyl carrier protein [Dysgonomonas sp.]